MRLNLDEYSAHRNPIKLTLTTRGEKEFASVSAMYAATGACPIFVVYLHVGELIGYNDWLMERLHKMAEFYDYTEIVGEATIDTKQFEVKK
jgi:hypothetical protein